ncbi:hypothetical protein [Paenibacillus sp. MBLB4367]|uniref:hypothetical protein n=1 Tax=Paenibacillus sp. MBLB4367 TaxID=3384767 RepID=UPI003907F9B8
MEQSERTGSSVPHLPDWDWFLDCLRQEDMTAPEQSVSSHGHAQEGESLDWVTYT